MKCQYPIKAYLDRSDNSLTFKNVTNKKNWDLQYIELQLPCGKCDACKLTRSRDWVGRLMAHYQMVKKGVFVTLTYDDDHLPSVLVKKHLQDFFKRLRNYFDVKITYFACGEYGSTTLRPHYHALIFGVDENDLLVAGCSSSILSKLWPYGFNYVGYISDQSCSYVSRYTLKKSKIDFDFESYGLVAPFQLQSKGLGLQYLINNYDNIVSNAGYFHIGGSRYYLSRYFRKKISDVIDRKLTLKRKIIGRIYSSVIDYEALFESDKEKVKLLKKRR